MRQLLPPESGLGTLLPVHLLVSDVKTLLTSSTPGLWRGEGRASGTFLAGVKVPRVGSHGEHGEETDTWIGVHSPEGP